MPERFRTGQRAIFGITRRTPSLHFSPLFATAKPEFTREVSMQASELQRGRSVGARHLRPAHVPFAPEFRQVNVQQIEIRMTVMAASQFADEAKAPLLKERVGCRPPRGTVWVTRLFQGSPSFS